MWAINHFVQAGPSRKHHEYYKHEYCHTYTRTFMDAILLEIERSMNLSPIWTVNPPTRVGSTCVWRTIVSFAPTLLPTTTRAHA